jgi:hypothetical protein
MQNPTTEVQKRIRQIYADRNAKVLALADVYSKACLDEFQAEQKTGAGNIGKFWHNRTAKASDRMFVGSSEDSKGIEWFMAHTMYYGVFLELSNNRQNEAIRPLVEKWGMIFIAKVHELYGDVGAAFMITDVHTYKDKTTFDISEVGA